MMKLSECISHIRKNEYTEFNGTSGFTDGGVLDIKALLLCDRLFRTVDQSEYDAVILADGFDEIGLNGLKVGQKVFGDIMFDKLKRFPDGRFIITSPIESVTPVFSELTLVKTENTTYLVIH